MFQAPSILEPDCGNWMYAAFSALRAALAPKAIRRTRMHWNQAKAAYIVPRLNLETLMRSVNFAMRDLVKARVRAGQTDPAVLARPPRLQPGKARRSPPARSGASVSFGAMPQSRVFSTFLSLRFAFYPFLSLVSSARI